MRRPDDLAMLANPWKARVFLGCVAILALPSCGAHEAAAGYYEERAPNEQAAGDQWQAGTAAPPEPAVTVSSESSNRKVASDRRPAYDSPPSRPMPAAKSSGGQSASYPPPQKPQSYSTPRQQPQAQGDSPKLSEPMVVYLGYLHLRVKRLIEAIDAVTALAKQHGGYVETLAGRTMVIRVPAHDFEGVMAAFAGVGEVLDRRVKALDVSRQFTDTRARLEIAREARERLLHLLKTVTNVEERLQILEEVKRLTEQIETAESALATLRNLADFFTITIELEPVVAQTAGTAHRSPFAWVRALSPHAVTLERGKKRIDLKPPSGFVQFEDDDLWRAQAADTSMLRGAVVENEPKGDAEFWSRAIAHEMEGRDLEPVESVVLGVAHVRVWRSKDLRPNYYVVAVAPAGDDIGVIEAFLPNEAAWQSHRAALEQALTGLRVAP